MKAEQKKRAKRDFIARNACDGAAVLASGYRRRAERFLSSQADDFTGVKWKEKRRLALFEMTVRCGGAGEEGTMYRAPTRERQGKRRARRIQKRLGHFRAAWKTRRISMAPAWTR